MNREELNILFTCVGRRAYLLDYFKEQLNGDGQIVATDMSATAPALASADIREMVPAVYAPDYIEKVIEICRRHKIKALISLNDLELPILAKNKHRFEHEGVKVIVSDPEVIDICFDKYATAKFLEARNLPTAKTYVKLDEALGDIEEGKLEFPLVLKPRWGSGSIGIEFVKTVEELKETYHALIKKIKMTILATASEGEEYVLIQEQLMGQEYGMDVMNDLEGKTRGVAVKKKLSMRAGETDKATTVDVPAIEALGWQLGKELGHIGNLDVDVKKHKGEYKILELNPRFGGGFPFSYESGVNFPGAIIKWLKGEESDDKDLKPRIGETYAKCDHLVKF